MPHIPRRIVLADNSREDRPLRIAITKLDVGIYIPIAIQNFVFSGSRLGSYLEVVIEANRKQYCSIARIGRLSNFQRWP